MEKQVKYTVGDALRTIGYLLEYHGTTGYYARNNIGDGVSSNSEDACSWCLLGAMCLVAGKMQVRPIYKDIYKDIMKLAGFNLNCGYGLARFWDVILTEEERLSLCKKLQSYED
jgi:hypothetical protein